MYEFGGRQARVYGRTAPNGGRVEVVIDGGQPCEVDTYSPAVQGAADLVRHRRAEVGGAHARGSVRVEAEHPFHGRLVSVRQARDRQVDAFSRGRRCGMPAPYGMLGDRSWAGVDPSPKDASSSRTRPTATLPRTSRCADFVDATSFCRPCSPSSCGCRRRGGQRSARTERPAIPAAPAWDKHVTGTCRGELRHVLDGGQPRSRSHVYLMFESSGVAAVEKATLSLRFLGNAGTRVLLRCVPTRAGTT